MFSDVAGNIRLQILFATSYTVVPRVRKVFCDVAGNISQALFSGIPSGALPTFALLTSWMADRVRPAYRAALFGILTAFTLLPFSVLPLVGSLLLEATRVTASATRSLNVCSKCDSTCLTHPYPGPGNSLPGYLLKKVHLCTLDVRLYTLAASFSRA
jgi:hypothetical protein